MSQRTESEAGNRLRGEMAPVRVSFTWFGTRKSLSAEQKARAESFGAERQILTAGKKLFDTTHPAFKVVTAGPLSTNGKECRSCSRD